MLFCVVGYMVWVSINDGVGENYEENVDKICSEISRVLKPGLKANFLFIF